ncbi:MAG: DNA methyltransferase [Nitrososphaeraceae archaeon]
MPLLTLKINPEYEALVPTMSKESYETLVSSIRANGQYEPIIVNVNGIILDGHQRFRACNKLKIKPTFEVKQFDDLLAEKLFVIDTNLVRRQLTQAQRIQLSLRKKSILHEQAKRNESLGGKGVQICTPLRRINEVIAKDAGVSARQVTKFETISKKANVQLLNRVLTAKTTIDKAYNDIKAEEKREEVIQRAKQEAMHILASSKLQYELFEGDFRAVASTKLTDSSIDLIFTDPPYNDDSLLLYKDLARLADRVLKPGGSLITYFGQYALPIVLKYISENSSLDYWWQLCVIHSGRHQDRVWNRYVIADWKPLLWLVKGKRDKSEVAYYMHDSIVSELPDKTLHEWKQSTKESTHIIKGLTLEGQTVLDPFCGAGTTAIAVLRLKRKFIGIDIDPRAIEATKANLTLSLQSQIQEGEIS